MIFLPLSDSSAGRRLRLVQVLGAADHADYDLPLDKPLYWVGESLRRLGQRVMALEQSGNSAPNWYAVEVKK